MLSTSTEGVQKNKTKKTSVAIGKTRTLHQEGQLDLLLDELDKFNIDIAGIPEALIWM